ncbi:hypothetical protein P7K49_012050 [Saguinus oedipus]|uniref:Uncharacterized protein n=1 Tax=Saguinus oedipus TaxID=9490 RepID=A0ABQ9VSE1_SAGOE|nr:hypothetical protein P7K49_012050 [Saguinus oedipus]
MDPPPPLWTEEEAEDQPASRALWRVLRLGQHVPSFSSKDNSSQVYSEVPDTLRQLCLPLRPKETPRRVSWVHGLLAQTARNGDAQFLRTEEESGMGRPLP